MEEDKGRGEERGGANVALRYKGGGVESGGRAVRRGGEGGGCGRSRRAIRGLGGGGGAERGGGERGYGFQKKGNWSNLFVFETL